MWKASFLLAATLVWAQPSPSDLDRVRVGEPAPVFEALDSDGKSRRLSDFRGKEVVLVFYRGHW